MYQKFFRNRNVYDKEKQCLSVLWGWPLRYRRNIYRRTVSLHISLDNNLVPKRKRKTMRMLKKQVLFQDKEKTFSVLLADSRCCFLVLIIWVKSLFLQSESRRKNLFAVQSFVDFPYFVKIYILALEDGSFCIGEENKNYLCRLFWRTTCFFLDISPLSL